MINEHTANWLLRNIVSREGTNHNSFEIHNYSYRVGMQFILSFIFNISITEKNIRHTNEVSDIKAWELASHYQDQRAILGRRPRNSRLRGHLVPSFLNGNWGKEILLAWRIGPNAICWTFRASAVNWAPLTRNGRTSAGRERMGERTMKHLQAGLKVQRIGCWSIPAWSSVQTALTVP